MKLLIVSNYFESHRGGVEIVAGELSRALAARGGFQITWIAADASPPPSNGSVRAVPLSSLNSVERSFGVPLPIPLARGLAVIWREVRACEMVMLHDAYYLSNLVAMLLAKRASKPVVIVQHIGIVPYRKPVTRWLMQLAERLMSRPMLARADQVVFISGLTQRYFSNVKFKRSPRLIFNGIRNDLMKRSFRHFRARPNADSSFTAIFVGRFVEKKGLPIVQCLATKTPDIRWIICGWGDERPEDWKLANVEVRRNLDTEQLAQAYREADLLILPSTGEGLPLVVQEALAFGLKVIAGADLLEADPWLCGRISGIALDPENPVGTAALWLAEIEAIRGKPTQFESAEDARQRYNWTRIADDYDLVLRGLVEVEKNHVIR